MGERSRASSSMRRGAGAPRKRDEGLSLHRGGGGAAAERAIRANKQQREQWRAELGKILAEQKTPSREWRANRRRPEMRALGRREATAAAADQARACWLRRPGSPSASDRGPLRAAVQTKESASASAARAPSRDGGVSRGPGLPSCAGTAKPSCARDRPPVAELRVPHEVRDALIAMQVERQSQSTCWPRGQARRVAMASTVYRFAHGQTGTGKTHTIFVCLRNAREKPRRNAPAYRL